MTTPTEGTGPADVDRVKRWLYANDPAVADDATLIAEVCEAVNAFITSYMATPANGEWPADVMQGATMLAARNIERRNSPVGVSQGIDGATYIPGRDRDLDQYLRLGQYRRLVVG